MARPVRVLALLCAVMMVLAGTAVAASPNPTADCNANGRLTAHYSPAQLRQALATMPADTKEYTDCYDVIQRTLLSELGQLKGTGSGSSGSSFLPTPVLIVLIVVVLAGAALATVALRRRASTGGAD